MKVIGMPPVKQLAKENFETFRQFLGLEGFSFEERPNQLFLARKPGAVINLYTSGKVVLGGSDENALKSVLSLLDQLGAIDARKEEMAPPPSIDVTGTRIGTDEVGKGDYFGPLVVAGVLVTPETEAQLKALGVRDSKTLSDTTITNKAIQIRKIVGRKNCEEICISPLRYNLLYQKLRNVNRILGWGHARAIENLLHSDTECDKAIADQFGDQSYIQNALMRKGREIRLVQVPKAERDVAVAAASVLARDTFIRKIREIQEAYLLDFPKGASHVLEFGKNLVRTHGVGVLQNVAKLHFSTTKQVTDGIIPTVKAEVETIADLESVSKEPASRELREARLELFNLIISFEEELRRFVRERLEAAFGPGWWEKCVDEQVRKKCEGRVSTEFKKGRKVDPADCLDFEHYWLILTARENWDHVFAKHFKDKHRLQARLTILKDIRDPVSHARGVFGQKEIAEAVASIYHLRQLMTANP